MSELPTLWLPSDTIGVENGDISIKIHNATIKRIKNELTQKVVVESPKISLEGNIIAEDQSDDILKRYNAI
jgi:hypothetical protein